MSCYRYDVNFVVTVHFRAGKMEKKDRETNMKLLIFWLERIQRKEPGELITFILDTTDSSIRNSDLVFTSFIIECFTTYFPYMLGECVSVSVSNYIPSKRIMVIFGCFYFIKNREL